MHVAELATGVLESEPRSGEWVACTRALAEAAFSPSRKLAQESTQAIFTRIVEPWADQFDPALCERYMEFMSEVLYAPNSPVAPLLADLGYPTPGRLRDRYRRVCQDNMRAVRDRDKVKKVVVLSRVTLGADIAVTSTVMMAAYQAFRDADIDFVGPRKNAALFTETPHVEGRYAVSYSRGAVLASRLATWAKVRARVQACVKGLRPGEWIVIDPDSRLTQLGLLPVVDDEHYRFFESRSYAEDDPAPLGRLTADWCCGVMLDVSLEHTFPSPELHSWESSRGNFFRLGSRALAASVSFGVGGKESKRLGGWFEDALLELLRRRRYRIVLDYGAGEEEARLIDERIRAFSGSVAPIKEQVIADLMTWKGNLPGFGGLTQCTQVYIGYDSAAAHLASALHVPVIEVFTGAASERMRQRWTPAGPGPVHVIPADGPQDGPAVLAKIEERLVEIEKTFR